MGSVGNQNPWQTYDTYKDCSQGICSIYCPQWCYIIFPPPPPFTLRDVEDGGSGTDFSPLIIAVIGILASAFILVSYYTIISKYCRRRSGHDGGSIEWDEHHQHTNESWQGSNTNDAAAGLDESVIKSITVCKYKKGDGFVIDGTDCPVCLTEFQENETLRLLPKCSHAFHLPCIDTWLKSQATCPLCRANIASTPTQQPRPPENQETPATTTGATTVTAVTAQQYQQQRSNDSVLVIQDLERFVQEEAEVNLGIEVEDGLHFNLPKPAVQDLELSENMMETREDNVNEIQPIRRSVSLNSSMCHNQMSVADILRINEDDDDDETIDIEKNKLGILNLVRSPLALKRSMSTGRFMFITRYETGRSSGIPN